MSRYPQDLTQKFKAREQRNDRKDYITEKMHSIPAKPTDFVLHGERVFRCTGCNDSKPTKGRKKLGIKFFCVDCQTKHAAQQKE